MKCYLCLRNGPKDFGAGEWTRTIDLLITNQLLYQLSYAGVGERIILADFNPPARARRTALDRVR